MQLDMGMLPPKEPGLPPVNHMTRELLYALAEIDLLQSHTKMYIENRHKEQEENNKEKES